eukprot:4953237-Prymnesium_polylepis.1
MGEGGATLNLDRPFHHPFISTASTKKLSALHVRPLGGVSYTLGHSVSILLERIRSCSCPAGQQQHATTILGVLFIHILRQLPGGLLGPWSPSG